RYGGRHGASVVVTSPPTRSTARERPRAGRDRVQRRKGGVEARHLHEDEALRSCTLRLGAVAGRCEEHGRLGLQRTSDLLLDATDRSDLAEPVDRAGARDRPSAGDATGGELVDDAEREREARARTADVVR